MEISCKVNVIQHLSINHAIWSFTWIACLQLIMMKLCELEYWQIINWTSIDMILAYFWSVFSCDQAALWMVLSVSPSVCLSVCLPVTPFSLCFCHRIIMKFSGATTIDKSDVHAKGQSQRPRSQRLNHNFLPFPFTKNRQIWPNLSVSRL